MKEQPNAQHFASLKAALRKKRTWLLALTAILCGILFSFQGPRCCLYGWLRLEPTYRWLPASYWRAVVLDAYRPRIWSMAEPKELVPLVCKEAERYYDENWSLSTQAVHLRRSDPSLMPLILRFLEDETPEVRWQGLLLLNYQADLGPGKAHLLELLGSQDSFTCQQAVETLGRMGPNAHEALPQLRTLLKTAQTDLMKHNIAFAMKQIDPSDTESSDYMIELLRSQLKARNPYHPWASPTAARLSKLKPPVKEALPILVQLAREGDAYTSRYALNAIRQMDPDIAKREGLVEKNEE